LKQYELEKKQAERGLDEKKMANLNSKIEKKEKSYDIQTTKI